MRAAVRLRPSRSLTIAALVTGYDDAGAEDGLAAFERLMGILGLDEICADVSDGDLSVLVDGVNAGRLSNFPCAITKEELAAMDAASASVPLTETAPATSGLDASRGG